METILLSGFDWAAQIAPGQGMCTLRLEHGGSSILRPQTTEVPDGVAYGNPLLMPPNRTAYGKFTFDGRDYQLPVNEVPLNNHLHGFLYLASFTVTEKTATAVTAVYENNGDIFPFPYRVTAHYSISSEGYRQSFTFENTGDWDMPLTFALHTNFMAPNVLQVPLGKRWVTNDCFIPNGQLQEPEGVCKELIAGSASQGQIIDGFFQSAGNTVCLDDLRFTVSDNFDQWVLWNHTGDGGFISVEPQQGAVNALNSGEGLLRLKPGQAETYTAHIYFA